MNSKCLLTQAAMSPKCFGDVQKRLRTTKAGKAGAQLKGNRFTISKNFQLYKLWESTKLKIPSLSDFSRYMGNLKPILMVGAFNNPNQPGKLQASTISPLNITCQELAQLLQMESITHHYSINKQSITSVNKDISQSPIVNDLHPNLTACTQHQEKKVISEKKPSEQTYEEWLAAFS